jgi:hypothetical protein
VAWRRQSVSSLRRESAGTSRNCTGSAASSRSRLGERGRRRGWPSRRAHDRWRAWCPLARAARGGPARPPRRRARRAAAGPRPPRPSLRLVHRGLRHAGPQGCQGATWRDGMSRERSGAWFLAEARLVNQWLSVKLVEKAMPIRFALMSRPPKRNYKLGVCHRSSKQLIYVQKAKWVPNGPSEQPQRKPGMRERFRASEPSSRCTAVRQKWRNSWASAGRSADVETVRAGRIGGARGIRTRGTTDPGTCYGAATADAPAPG